MVPVVQLVRGAGKPKGFQSTIYTLAYFLDYIMIDIL
jgi:hypothetical protein